MKRTVFLLIMLILLSLLLLSGCVLFTALYDDDEPISITTNTNDSQLPDYISPQLPYSNNFTETSNLDLNEWLNLHGNYQDLSIENGWLNIEASSEYSINLLSSNAVPLTISDYTIETVMKGTTNSRWGVNYYANYYQQPSDKAWNIHFTWEARYQRWQINVGDGNNHIIEYRDDIGMEEGHSYYIKMYIKDNILYAFLDNELMFDVPMETIFSTTGRSYPYFSSGSCGPTATRYDLNYPAEVWVDYFYVYETP